jgi:hypothetical protein
LSYLLNNFIGLDLHHEVTAAAKIEPKVNVLRQVLLDLRPAREVLNAGLMMWLEDDAQPNDGYDQYYYGSISDFALHPWLPV